MFYTHQPVGVRPISPEWDSYLFWSDGGSVLTEWNLRQFFNHMNFNGFSIHLSTGIAALSRGGLTFFFYRFAPRGFSPGIFLLGGFPPGGLFPRRFARGGGAS